MLIPVRGLYGLGALHRTFDASFGSAAQVLFIALL
jgi:hypothetical protein